MAKAAAKTTKQTATKANTTKTAPPKKVTAASMRQVKKQIEQKLTPVVTQSQASTNSDASIEKSTQVDSFVPNGAAYEVVVDNGKVYSTYMMWSDMKNNHNKYYIV